MTEKDLLEKKEKIEKTKTKLSELKGEQKALTKQLKDNWGCATLAEAKKKIISFETKTKELEKQIEEDTEILMETYFTKEEE